MDLQLSVFLLFILFTGGQSLRCYECMSLNGSCAGQTVTTCPELSTCFSSTAVTAIELSGDSSSNVPNFPNVPNIPNGKKCYYCVGNSCSNIMDCSGTADRCFTAKVAYGGQSMVAKSCVSKSVCDAATSNPNVGSVSCCEGDLCNGAQSVSQSFLFLCCSLLSYFLLH
ncbi:hypothetical protein DPX16_3886 [Anabarilius grahami]|uniref:Uncharacterized protein n=1 Tax=Anabarilius grahami TaxID=495550 RepID=A0A3N0XST3_ANAGA|nr:hypothetical protein DPX16_3886 [Anabarilius grahami]